jgi:hypothetical protein
VLEIRVGQKNRSTEFDVAKSPPARRPLGIRPTSSSIVASQVINGRRSGSGAGERSQSTSDEEKFVCFVGEAGQKRGNSVVNDPSTKVTKQLGDTGSLQNLGSAVQTLAKDDKLTITAERIDGANCGALARRGRMRWSFFRARFRPS